jgi:hypothetical protein
MKKGKLPLPVLVLILATLFLFSSTLGEWIGRPSTTARRPASETVEQQQAAIVYLRVMSWLSQVITRPIARAEDKVESAPPVQLTPAATPAVAHHRVQMCVLSKPPRPSRSTCKSSHRAL